MTQVLFLKYKQPMDFGKIFQHISSNKFKKLLKMYLSLKVKKKHYYKNQIRKLKQMSYREKINSPKTKIKNHHLHKIYFSIKV